MDADSINRDKHLLVVYYVKDLLFLMCLLLHDDPPPLRMTISYSLCHLLPVHSPPFSLRVCREKHTHIKNLCDILSATCSSAQTLTHAYSP